MKLFNVLLISLLGTISTAALADDGSDRSKQFLAEFRQQQQQVHGSEAVAQTQSAEADNTSKEAI
ncbi:hypothetical protein HKK55_00840 [Pseudomonas sp. ADAK18]|uniref:hypothetical protein n=1 Tax=Pseudomonas sp. ADAK18 TaxID=2730848 RepID=UPI001463E5CD|nr:hypothetical protein [Pseudomonas sp. ADAK18]QJI27310.1 hypothetical protein HKK55_00840 [Pseudomonas sp. ADAK18]